MDGVKNKSANIEKNGNNIDYLSILETCYRTPHTKIDISHINSGIYFVKITTDAGEVVKKVIKQ